MVSVSVPSVQSSLERLIFHQDALPHGKSSFVRFKYLFSSDSELVSPPSLQRRSSALVAATGYHRTYPRWLLNHAEEVQQILHRPRPRQYGPEVREEFREKGKREMAVS